MKCVLIVAMVTAGTQPQCQGESSPKKGITLSFLVVDVAHTANLTPSPQLGSQYPEKTQVYTPLLITLFCLGYRLPHNRSLGLKSLENGWDAMMRNGRDHSEVIL